MTRPHNAQTHCPNCETWHTSETFFGRWIRNNPELDSGKGYCVVDQDYWIHQFKTDSDGRKYQKIMLVEIKVMCAELTDAQRDTLLSVNELMTGEIKRINGFGDDITVTGYGVHVLRFSGLGVEDSETIIWDRTPIDEKTLTELLGFKINPVTLLNL